MMGMMKSPPPNKAARRRRDGVPGGGGKKRSQLFGKTLFVDLMMSTLVVVTALLMVSNAVKKQTATQLQESSLRTDGQFAIVMEWPDKSRDDVDLYVRDPTGRIVYFSARDVGLMHLEHDDQGQVSDSTQTSNGDVSVDRNEERVIIRGIIPGEYIVNVQMFNKRDLEPTPVTIRLIRLKGQDEELVKKERVLENKGDEATAFRFTAKADASVSNVVDLPFSMASRVPNGPSLFNRRGGW